MSNWIEDFALHLRSAGYRGGKTFALEMPETVPEGAVIVPPQEGLRSSREMPTYYRGEFLVVVRTKDPSQLMALAAEAVQLLTMDNAQVGGVRVVTCYSTNSPTPFPRNDAGTYECAVEMNVALIDQRMYAPPGTPMDSLSGNTITVFYDNERDSIFLSTHAQPFPDRSLVAEQHGDLISIKVANIDVTVVPPRLFSVFKKENGDGFSNAAEVLQYLNEEFSQSDRVSPPGDNDLSLTAQGALGGHRAVVEIAGRRARYPSISTASDADIIIGVTVGAAADGEAVSVRLVGEMIEGTWNWTPGPIFAGDNGVLTQTPPAGAWIRQVGVAVAPTIMVVGLRPPFMTP